MKRWAFQLTLFLLVLTGGSIRAETVINVAVASSGPDLALMQAAADRYNRVHPGVSVRLLLMPEITDDRFDLISNFLALESPELDLIQLDIVWVHQLGRHLVDLNETTLAPGASLHDDHLVRLNTVDDRLVALPWSAHIGVLFSRGDLLARHGFAAPPSTWDELEQIASHIQEHERAAGNASFWGYVWQGAPYEGLMVNAIEWFASVGAGTIVERDPAVSIDNAGAAQMLERARSWIGTISPPEVLGFIESDALDHMLAGNAAFLRSWTPDWKQLEAQPLLQGNIMVSPIPASHEPAGVRGGASLGISRYSRHPEVAARVLKFLTTEHEQAHRAMQGGMAPTRSALYSDPEVLASMPFLAELRDHFLAPVERPHAVSGSEYVRVSRLSYNTFHYLLAGKADIGNALETLSATLQGILRIPEGPPAP